MAEIAVDKVHVVLEWYIGLFNSLFHLVGVQSLSLPSLSILKIYIVFINVVLTFWRERVILTVLHSQFCDVIF